MRTLMIILVGLALAALICWLTPASRRTLAVGIFSFVWLIASLVNLRIGMSHGYTFAQELPIHIVLFGVPTLAAWLGWWYTR